MESAQQERHCSECGGFHTPTRCPYYGELGSQMSREEALQAARRALEDEEAGVWPFPPKNPEDTMRLRLELNLFGYSQSESNGLEVIPEFDDQSQ